MWRKGLTHPAFDALRQAAARLAAEEGWLRRPVGRWIPAGDDVLMTSHD
ncbi:hypothetical protein [Streptomyces sp. NPDC092370]